MAGARQRRSAPGGSRPSVWSTPPSLRSFIRVAMSAGSAASWESSGRSTVDAMGGSLQYVAENEQLRCTGPAGGDPAGGPPVTGRAVSLETPWPVWVRVTYPTGGRVTVPGTAGEVRHPARWSRGLVAAGMARRGVGGMFASGCQRLTQRRVDQGARREAVTTTATAPAWSNGSGIAWFPSRAQRNEMSSQAVNAAIAG